MAELFTEDSEDRRMRVRWPVWGGGWGYGRYVGPSPNIDGYVEVQNARGLTLSVPAEKIEQVTKATEERTDAR